MINFDLKPIDESFKIIYNELNTYTTAATLLVNRFHFFSSWLHEIDEFLKFVQLPETTENDCPRIGDDFYIYTGELLTALPGLMVCYPQANWSDIVNSIISLINNYIGYQDTICKVRNDENQIIRLQTMRDQLQHIAQYIEFGANIEILLPLVAQLIDRLAHLDSNQPMTFELSKMYLNALGFCGKDEVIV